MHSANLESSRHELVAVERAGAVAWLRLNRPEAMNALNKALVDHINAQLDWVEKDPHVRVVVLTGTGRAFCTGADLKEATELDGSIDPDRFLGFIKRIAAMVERLPTLDKPVIAAVNGFALAGGMELMMACDLVIAAETARIADAHSNFGLVPGAGGAARLVRIAGPIVAKYLAFTGEFLPAARLVQWGLVNEVVPNGDLQARVDVLARQIAGKSSCGLRRMKRLVADGLDQPLHEALRLEHAALAHQARSDDLREGLAAFKEKRPPRFATD